MTPEEQKEIYKEAIKEALSEWLDKQFILVGKWTIRGIAAAMLAMMVYVYAASHGWGAK